MAGFLIAMCFFFLGSIFLLNVFALGQNSVRSEVQAVNLGCVCALQEPPKEDLTVSEKFQLVLDVAQKAQVP